MVHIKIHIKTLQDFRYAFYFILTLVKTLVKQRVRRPFSFNLISMPGALEKDIITK